MCERIRKSQIGKQNKRKERDELIFVVHIQLHRTAYCVCTLTNATQCSTQVEHSTHQYTITFRDTQIYHSPNGVFHSVEGKKTTKRIVGTIKCILIGVSTVSKVEVAVFLSEKIEE